MRISRRAFVRGSGAFGTVLLSAPLSSALQAANLPAVVQRIKPGVVGVGTYAATQRPPAQLRGTGFVVADGNHVITNAHVVAGKLKKKRRERRIILAGQGAAPDPRDAKVVAEDPAHDLALMKFFGSPLPTLRFGDDLSMMEGQAIAFTGFPIGAVLGLHAATHRGIIAAIVPIVLPQLSGRHLDTETIRQIQNPFVIFQLDATAYPGNSGSPVFDPETGEVIGVVNSVYVKNTKEKVLQDPSGITYAIPARHVRALLKSANLVP
jgi:S1-C subfamily serine protease